MKFREWAIIIGVLVFVGLAFVARTLSPLYFIPSGSMEPALLVGDRITGQTSAYKNANPARGDIALLSLPLALVALGTGTGTSTFVKRVVAVPGERVEIAGGKLKINGAVVSEPYASWKGGPLYDLKVVRGAVVSRDYGAGVPGLWTQNGVLLPPSQQTLISRAPTGTLPPQRYLVLGDNRGNANDSHVWGFAPRSAFFARVSARLWPSPRRF